jgi:hypothetical protein
VRGIVQKEGGLQRRADKRKITPSKKERERESDRKRKDIDSVHLSHSHHCAQHLNTQRRWGRETTAENNKREAMKNE